eukprot:gene49446-biopygen29837
MLFLVSAVASYFHLGHDAKLGLEKLPILVGSAQFLVTGLLGLVLWKMEQFGFTYLTCRACSHLRGGCAGSSTAGATAGTVRRGRRSPRALVVVHVPRVEHRIDEEQQEHDAEEPRQVQ